MQVVTNRGTYPFLKGGGEMGELTRQFEWSKTSVGSPDQWPYALRSTVSNILRSKFPMFLWWGEEMIQFYNDAYRPSMGRDGKHPSALGQKGKECWPEIWDIISPLLEQVKTTGEATWMEDQLVPINRNGRLEDVYWTFSYSSVLDDDGQHGGIMVTCTETTDKVVSQLKLQESERLLRNTIYQAPVAICIYRGEALIIEEANEKMIEFWGKSSEQVMHKPLFEAMPEAKNQGYEELLDHVLKTGQPYSANEQPVTLPRNGIVQTVYINFSFTPIHEPDGTHSGIMAMAIDVTEQVLARYQIEEVVRKRTLELAEANNALVVANRGLQRSNTSLEEFAYAASHDLKEPIRKIHFFEQRIKNALSDQITPEQQHCLQRMESATQRMESLIDNLLAYSQVSIKPQRLEPVDLNQLLQLVLEDLELQIEEKKAVITVDVLCTIKAYPSQLQQAFYNLLANALKYTRSDVVPYVHISCTTISGKEINKRIPENEQQKTFYCVRVQDNGIGFEQADAERIFNVFTRLHGLSEYKGSGVGLSIVRKVIENHNGYIWAESNPGEGATFKVLLPAD